MAWYSENSVFSYGKYKTKEEERKDEELSKQIWGF